MQSQDVLEGGRVITSTGRVSPIPFFSSSTFSTIASEVFFNDEDITLDNN